MEKAEYTMDRKKNKGRSASPIYLMSYAAARVTCWRNGVEIQRQRWRWIPKRKVAAKETTIWLPER